MDLKLFPMELGTWGWPFSFDIFPSLLGTIVDVEQLAYRLRSALEQIRKEGNTTGVFSH